LASVQLNVTAGSPYYYAVFVNGTTWTNWPPFTITNLIVSLGPTDGVYTVNVGLRGQSPNASQAWQSITLTKDTAAPLLVVTNPVSGTVDEPMIQLQGYATKSLSGLTFDVSNALGVVTGQQGFVTDQCYDTNLWKLTTNYFQCFDVDLTNGPNIITLHATDLAGNVTSSNFTFTVDYSGKTNPPVVQITWPQNGMQVCGSSFTLDGMLADPTASVAAQIVDTNGTTNSVLSGVVERDGRFWLDNLPLSSGTNTLTITVTDAVGNTSVTNLCVVQSTLILTMDPVTPASQLWQATVNLTGTISDSSQAVWVNGVKGHNNGNGTWYANNVPTTPGGVASFSPRSAARW
jgi:hypothetical protein